MHTSSPPTLTMLRSRLPDLMLRDQHRLRRRLDGVRKIRSDGARQSAEAAIVADVDRAERRLAGRQAGVPAVTYPAALPVSQKKDDILAAIRDHQVVIVAGETGSGKTTQLPKICLELGRGVRGMIGHTQPRRIAARTVAERIAAELDTPLGGAVGWKVRFTDKVGDDTLVKVMTDGILLAEIQHDRLLRDYDTLIIDEAHERSLNIDFILGYVKQLLPRRPDLKVIITSATIDPERFAQHFQLETAERASAAEVPIVEVSGRTYPVEVRYRPVVDDAEDRDRDQIQAICDAVDELLAEGPGDILVFLSGEREIRDTADALSKQNLRHTEILPLYARLSSADQHRVFQSHGGRRIVLATNVAETSLTVPGIKYVIDPGTARISRYSHRLKVQRLPIEPVSQASANQRKGRCGRTSDGICIRLYSEEDFESRPEFTEPEIVRTNLASVILAMAAAGLGDIAAFPFIDPPDHRNIRAGIQLLEELGALDPKAKGPKLTPLGRTLSQLPLDPRFARMVVAAQDNGCVREVMVIAAALSIQDPRERPTDKEQQAAEKHARFVAEDSDFLAYLNLWKYLREKQDELSSNQFRKLCKAEFLNFLRVREWQDIESQLRQVTRGTDITLNSTPGEPQKIHLSLLAGLLSQIGVKDGEQQDAGKKGASRGTRPPRRRISHEYLGARGARFAVFPGSSLFKKSPSWVMAAELVETSRLWARVVAKIEPEWAEAQAQHLVMRSYSEPHWSKKQSAVLAYERVTLYGVPLAVNRRVNYGRIDPVVSREIFIRQALVEGQWETRHAFFHENRALLDEVEDLENRARRRDIVVDDETLFAFYDERLPADVVSGAHFDSWWKKVRRDTPDLLTFSTSMLVTDAAEAVRESDYPDFWHRDGLRLKLTYQFEPGSAADGVTVHIPLPVLNQVNGTSFSWQVPGLREELVTSLIRALPKQLRRIFVPAPDFAKAALQRLTPYQGALQEALGRELRAMSGTIVPRDAWQPDRVPEHLKMTFAVDDGKGRTLAEGKDLEALRRQLRDEMTTTLAKAAGGLERDGLRDWDFDQLPRGIAQRRQGYEVKAYPALADEGTSVAIRLYESESAQRRAMVAGTRRLLLLKLPAPIKPVLARLSIAQKLALGHSPHGDAGALFDDCLGCAVDTLVSAAGGPSWDAEGFAKLVDTVRADLQDTVTDIIVRVAEILRVAHELNAPLDTMTNPALAPAVADVRSQLEGLVFAGFVTAHGRDRLPDVLRYLRGIERRLDKVPTETQRDLEHTQVVARLQQSYDQLVGGLDADDPDSRIEGVEQVRWMLEELRVSFFAQQLGTSAPISEKRIRKVLDRLES
ncbi:ATP-dependent RNA helicase HrpA [Actinopolymorpha sp. B17G11]|uniref:ATP-dependent RNA helicase HrpA n=1 Tax=Actinopolymorpha sp. B17G11 TaxID=3160861 RepID=UPI0032E3AD0F